MGIETIKQIYKTIITLLTVMAIAASTTGVSEREGEIFSEALKRIGIYIVLALVISGLTSKFLF